MSRWGWSTPRCEVPDLVRQARVRDIRAARRGARWSRPLGFCCLGLAAWAVIDPDYPVTRSVPTASSAPGELELAPRLLTPVGAIATPRPRFSWRGPAAATSYDFVLLDEGLEELCRVHVLGRTFAATDAIAQRLERGGSYHWRVETEVAGRRFTSAPVAFCFSR